MKATKEEIGKRILSELQNLPEQNYDAYYNYLYNKLEEKEGKIYQELLVQLMMSKVIGRLNGMISNVMQDDEEVLLPRIKTFNQTP